GALLAFDVLEVEPGGSRRRKLRLGRRQELRALEMIDDREKVRGGDDLDLAGPGGFAAASSGADEPALARRCGQGREQYAGDARQRAVQCDLPERVYPASSSSGSTSIAARSANAIGRSKWLPSFSTSAGARLT